MSALNAGLAPAVALTAPALAAALVAPALLVALAALAIVLRRRRAALAADLHELRQSLTAARLMIDLTVAFSDTPGDGLIAAADQLARSHSVLAEFEQRFYEPGWNGPRRLRASARRLCGSGLFDALEETQRLACIWGGAARALGREFEFRSECGAVQLRGTRHNLTEALANLLANAIRHGEGAVTMSVRLRGEMLRIEVGDEGPGLRRPIASIVAARGGFGRRLGPHGHGLAIAVRAAGRLGGCITSAPSANGALIVLELPAVTARDGYEQFMPSGDAAEAKHDTGSEATPLRPVGVTGGDEA